MDQTADQLMGAVEEVTSVADELRALQQRVKQYSDASGRLQEVSDALRELTGSVTKMQAVFAGILSKAEKAQTQLEASKAAVEAMAQSIPEVVRRIEASDVAKGIAEFSASIAEAHRLVESHLKTMMETQSKLAEERREQMTIFREMGERTGRILTVMESLPSDLRGIKDASAQQTQLLQRMEQILTQNVAGAVNDNGRLLGELKVLLESVYQNTNKAGEAEFAVKLMREVAALRSELGSAKSLIEKNSGQLDAIGKKRGILF